MNWYWLLQQLQQPWREEDSKVVGAPRPSKVKETRSIPPSSSWMGTKQWQFSSLFLTDKRTVRRLCSSLNLHISTSEILCTGLLHRANIIFRICMRTHGDSQLVCLGAIPFVFPDTCTDMHTWMDTWRQGFTQYWWTVGVLWQLASVVQTWQAWHTVTTMAADQFYPTDRLHPEGDTEGREGGRITEDKKIVSSCTFNIYWWPVV